MTEQEWWLAEQKRRAEELRVGSPGQRQRDMLYGILTRALIAIEDIPVPWLDDCIDDARRAVEGLRAKIRADE